MEYIQRIRAKLGSEKILIPTTAIVILDKRDQVLLHLRTDTNTWGLPGGLMDIGETATESVRREAFEETGLSVGQLSLFGIFSGPRFEAKYPNGDEIAPVVLGFYSEEYSGAISERPESHEVGFYSLSRLPENLNPFHRWFLEGFMEFRKTGSMMPVIS